jgi:hypothetical protein
MGSLLDQLRGGGRGLSKPKSSSSSKSSKRKTTKYGKSANLKIKTGKGKPKLPPKKGGK